ncbi:hypothetical protein CcaverHIS002_0309340 [Cutaneotrichosporon cavernicola]|nr:hypothetical protein CcaverHIS002_0309340 [Cutaneotrichosporon cavernicola]
MRLRGVSGPGVTVADSLLQQRPFPGLDNRSEEAASHDGSRGSAGAVEEETEEDTECGSGSGALGLSFGPCLVTEVGALRLCL